MSAEALPRCSFCGRGKPAVKVLVQGKSGDCICEFCTAECSARLAQLDESEQAAQASPPTPLFPSGAA